MTRIVVEYNPARDRVEAHVEAIDGRTLPEIARVDVRETEWSDDLRFRHANGHVIGFAIDGFRSFVDYLPLYKLFGADFATWLSDVQTRFTGSGGGKDAYEVELAERDQRAARRFEEGLVSA